VLILILEENVMFIICVAVCLLIVLLWRRRKRILSARRTTSADAKRKLAKEEIAHLELGRKLRQINFRREEQLQQMKGEREVMFERLRNRQ
jgi:flagellar biosynthesis/type III secretory pathway M-ring protein FliF/YscJ